LFLVSSHSLVFATLVSVSTFWLFEAIVLQKCDKQQYR